jgi:hypothetical protein
MSGELRLPTGPRGGPFLQAALLCEKVLLEPDGAATAVRIVDQVTVQPVSVVVSEPAGGPTDDPSAEPTTPSEPTQAAGRPPRTIVLPAVMAVSLLVIFKSGSAPGHYLLEIVLRTPANDERSLPSQEIELSEVPHGGATHVHQLSLGLGEPGDYRFDVSLNGQFVTSIPLRVDFAPS